MSTLLLPLVACSDDDASSGTTTSVEQTTDGNVNQTVPTTDEVVNEPVALDAAADFGNGVTARITDVKAVEAEAFLPGERSGPAVELTIEVTNDTAGSIDLNTVTVDLVDAAGVSAVAVTPEERRELHGDLDAGASETGVYTFTLEPDARDDVTVRVSYTADAPTIVFAGSLDD